MEAYGYWEDGEIVAPVSMCSRFKEVGGWHLLSDEDRGAHGWFPCSVEEHTYDVKLYTSFDVKSFDTESNTFHITKSIVKKHDSQIRHELTTLLQQAYEKEMFKSFSKASYDELLHCHDLLHKGIIKSKIFVQNDSYTKLDKKASTSLLIEWTEWLEKCLQVKLDLIEFIQEDATFELDIVQEFIDKLEV